MVSPNHEKLFSAVTPRIGSASSGRRSSSHRQCRPRAPPARRRRRISFLAVGEFVSPFAGLLQAAFAQAVAGRNAINSARGGADKQQVEARENEASAPP